MCSKLTAFSLPLTTAAPLPPRHRSTTPLPRSPLPAGRSLRGHRDRPPARAVVRLCRSRIEIIQTRCQLGLPFDARPVTTFRGFSRPTGS